MELLPRTVKQSPEAWLLVTPSVPPSSAGGAPGLAGPPGRGHAPALSRWARGDPGRGGHGQWPCCRPAALGHSLQGPSDPEQGCGEVPADSARCPSLMKGRWKGH